MKLSQLVESNQSPVSNTQDAIGITPNNLEVDYRGIKVLMRPQKFLELAVQGGAAELNNIERLKQLIQDGSKIAPPMLTMELPDSWAQGDYTGKPVVVGHEGRNRMWALLELFGNDLVEVHIFPRYNRYEFRTRNLRPGFLDALKDEALAERTQRPVYALFRT